MNSPQSHQKFVNGDEYLNEISQSLQDILSEIYFFMLNVLILWKQKFGRLSKI